MEQSGDSRHVQAVENACGIIEVLEERDGAGVTELAEALGLTKGTVHCHLATLEDGEYVVNDDGTYHLSLRYLELGESVRERLGIFDVVRAEVEELADETDEVAQFATEEHGRAVYLEKSTGSKAVQTASSVGARQYLHCIALGKAMLAYMDRDRVEEIVETHGLEKQTENTITDREELFAALETIRERGYAVDDEEFIEGLRCIAAPVKTTDGVLGAVSVSGPSSRMDGDRFEEEFPNRVIRAANVIEINSKFA